MVNKKATAKKAAKKVAKKAVKKKAAPKKKHSKKVVVPISLPPEDVVPEPKVEPTEFEQLPNFAYYYPEPYWSNSDWVKNLILFFDGVAVLVPEYMDDFRGTDSDAKVVEELKRTGLFRVLRPETVVDQDVTKTLVELLEKNIQAGVFTSLAKENRMFASLSRSRLGYMGNSQLAERVFETLKEKGLAHDKGSDRAVLLQENVRAAVLVLLAQIIRTKGKSLGVELSPTTDQPRILTSLNELLTITPPQAPAASRVVTFDMQELGVDLADVPILEVLDFRTENQSAYRNYFLEVRKFVRELSAMENAQEQAIAFKQRKIELKDLGDAIANHATKIWRKPLSFGLGLLGTGIGVEAATTYAGLPQDQALVAGLSASAVGGVIRMIGAIIGGIGQPNSPDLGAFSYMFKAKGAFVH